jgi:REP element-mobilizing transposase RayT
MMPEWHSRGYLPHFNAPEAIQAITYRLSDSLPFEVVSRLADQLASLPEQERDAERRRRIERWMDAGHGCCLLRDAESARLVTEAWHRFDGERYRLLAWVVMPNHVHVVIELNGTCPLARIVQSWKSFTGRRLMDRMPAGCPSVWSREYWDRWMRDERHFRQTVAYVEGNPVAAKLVGRAEDWTWSSARERRAPARLDGGNGNSGNGNGGTGGNGCTGGNGG